MVKPTAEQQVALELFRAGEGLHIDAFAGSGKTTTLQLLAQDTSRVGHYLAFNRSIATEAKRKFAAVERPRGDAFLAVYLLLTRRENRNRLSGSRISISCTKSGIESRSSTRSSARLVVPKISYFHPGLLGHDGYLKLWALSAPKLAADYVMLDEAQDSNPVILGVLQNQSCQVVYVGDPYQQIYEWRGAVNAMEAVHTKHRARLTQSFRVGSRIANAASQVISRLGSTSSISGNPSLDSHVCPVHPTAILCRTNGGVISHLMLHLRSGDRCHILGGTSELQRLLEDVRKLKRGHPPGPPGFFRIRELE
jgi:UvrD-like helicase family protein